MAVQEQWMVEVVQDKICLLEERAFLAAEADAAGLLALWADVQVLAHYLGRLEDSTAEHTVAVHAAGVLATAAAEEALVARARTPEVRRQVLGPLTSAWRETRPPEFLTVIFFRDRRPDPRLALLNASCDLVAPHVPFARSQHRVLMLPADTAAGVSTLVEGAGGCFVLARQPVCLPATAEVAARLWEPSDPCSPLAAPVGALEAARAICGERSLASDLIQGWVARHSCTPAAC